jgi:hypothetical protein
MTPLLDQIAALRTRPGLVPEADQLLSAAAALQSGTLTLEEALKSLHAPALEIYGNTYRKHSGPFC